MDNFDLKKYLTEGRLFKENIEDVEVGEDDKVWVHKFTYPDTGETHYSPSNKISSPEKALKHLFSMVNSPTYADNPGSNPDSVYNKLRQWGIENIDSELVTTSTGAKVRDVVRQLKANDPKSIGSAIGGANRGFGASKVKVPKDQSISLGGKVYVNALYLQKNPDFKKRVSRILDKVAQNIPGKGSYFKIDSNNVERT